MKKMVILMGLALVSSHCFAEDAQECENPLNGAKYYVENSIYYKIINENPKEVSIVSRYHEGIPPIFDTWYYWDIELKNIPDYISIKGDKYAVSTISPDTFEATTKDINLPSTLRYIGDGNFWACEQPVKFENGPIELGDRCFTCCEFETLSLPASMKKIGDYSFVKCQFSSINFPSELSTIGSECVKENPNIEELVLPSTLQTIGNGCFNKNGNLKYVTLPDIIADLDDCFNECPEISQIIFTNPEPEEINISSNCFQDIDESKCLVVVPDGSKELYYAILSNQDSALSRLQIVEKSNVPAGINEIGSNETSECEYYTLDGIKLNSSNLENKGVYIKRNANKTEKVYVK